MLGIHNTTTAVDMFAIIFTQQAAEKPNGELTCAMAYIQSKGYLEVTGM